MTEILICVLNLVLHILFQQFLLVRLVVLKVQVAHHVVQLAQVAHLVVLLVQVVRNVAQAVQ